jgi:hypothetical protein
LDPRTDRVSPARAAGLAPLALLAVVLAALSCFERAQRWAGIDFYQFWCVGQAAREFPGTNVYSERERASLGALFLRRAREAAAAGAAQSPEAPGDALAARLAAAQAREVLETYSTPWLYTLFGACTSGDWGRDKARFQALSTLALALGAAWCARAAGAGAAGALLAAVLATALFAASDSCGRVGNVNRLQLGALALGHFLLCGAARARTVAAGALLGALVAFKPNLALAVAALGLGWLAAGQFARAAWASLGLALGGLVAWAASCAWFGTWSAWAQWAGELPELMQRYESPIEKGNLSLLRALEALGPTLSGRALAPVLLGLLALVLFVARRALADRLRSPGPGRARTECALLALGAALSVLTVELAWLHYYVLVLPLLLMLCFAPAAAVRAPALLLAFFLSLDGPRALFSITDSQPAAAWCMAGSTLACCLLGLFVLLREEPLAPAA